MKRLRDWYEHPEYYEAIFGTDTAQEMDFLQAVNRQHGTGGSLLLEPACGAGRLLAEGARRGLQLVGYDLSERMLAHARARLSGPERARVRLERAAMQAFHDPALEGQVDLAFNLVSTFRYLDSDATALAHLQGTRRLLRPQGLYVLGFHLTDYTRARPERERWVGTYEGATVVCNTQEGLPERRQRRAPMRNRLHVKGGGREELLIETEWYFRTYDARQARDLFKRAGLAPAATYDFDYRLDRPVARGSLRLDRIFVLRPL